MSIPLSDLWLRAVADLERAEETLRIAQHPDLCAGLEREVMERKGIVNALAWICDHQDLVADIMAAERRKTKPNKTARPNEATPGRA
jgi:hypothetical protein